MAFIALAPSFFARHGYGRGAGQVHRFRRAALTTPTGGRPRGEGSGMGLRAEGLAAFRGERLVLRDLSFSLARGGALLLVGPNGSGKSTLLRLLAGLKRPDAGAISWDGADIADDPAAQARRLRLSRPRRCGESRPHRRGKPALPGPDHRRRGRGRARGGRSRPARRPAGADAVGRPASAPRPGPARARRRAALAARRADPRPRRPRGGALRRPAGGASRARRNGGGGDASAAAAAGADALRLGG